MVKYSVRSVAVVVWLALSMPAHADFRVGMSLGQIKQEVGRQYAGVTQGELSLRRVIEDAYIAGVDMSAVAKELVILGADASVVVEQMISLGVPAGQVIAAVVQAGARRDVMLSVAIAAGADPSVLTPSTSAGGGLDTVSLVPISTPGLSGGGGGTIASPN